MRTLLLSAAAILPLAILVPAAHAADLGLTPGSYDWSGGYVGLTTGASINSSSFAADYRYIGPDDIGADEDIVNGLDYSGEANDLGFTAGLLAGYNWQSGNFVLGGEADLNYLGMNGTVTHGVSDVMNQIMAPTDVQGTDKTEYTADWFGTVRARLGYAADNVLIYGTGGIAYGQMKIKQKLDVSTTDEYAYWSGSTDGYNLGWTVGGGMEYGTGRWVLGAEYLYVDLGSYDWGSMAEVSLADPILNDEFSQVKQKGKADYTFSVARASVKYRF